MTLTAEELSHRAYALEQSTLLRALKPAGFVKISVGGYEFSVPHSTITSSLHCRILAMLHSEADDLERYALTGTREKA